MGENPRMEALMEEYDRCADRYRRFAESVEQLLKGLLKAVGIEASSVTHRLKDRDSFERKISSSDKYGTFEDVTDVAGARVTTYFADDVDKVAELIRREDNFVIDLQNSVDKRRVLRSDQVGYQSVHLVVSLPTSRIHMENREFEGLKVEIQVRSLLQHAWAEIEHGYYKSAGSLPPAVERRLLLIAGSLEVSDNEFVGVRKEADFAKCLPICRFEGHAELVPDFWMDLPFDAVQRPDQTLILQVNTFVTNRASADGVTTVELYVYEGTRRVPAVLLAPTFLGFRNVFPLPRPEKGRMCRIRISGLRVDALRLGIGSGRKIHVLARAGSADDPTAAPPLNCSMEVARILPGLWFSAFAAGSFGPPLKVGRSESSLDIPACAIFEPKTPNAFRTADAERSPTEMQAVYGTRLVMRLDPIPPGTRVFVTTKDLPDVYGKSCFELTASDERGMGLFRPVAASMRRATQLFPGEEADFAEISSSESIRYATWECVAAASYQRVARFGVLIALPPGAGGGPIIACGSLAPITGAITLSLDHPEPVFRGWLLTPVTLVEFQ